MATEAEINFDDIPELTEEQLKGGVRGKYYERTLARERWCGLRPDVAAAFPTEEAVNAALRILAEVARRQVPDPKPWSVAQIGPALEPGERLIELG